jgi:DNA-binding transcriptional MerR regulator
MLRAVERDRGYTVSDLMDLTGASRRQIHRWRTRRLLHPPAGARAEATYDAEHLRRVRHALSVPRGVTLDDLRERFENPRWYLIFPTHRVR